MSTSQILLNWTVKSSSFYNVLITRFDIVFSYYQYVRLAGGGNFFDS
jgi:hypothetical protein